MTTAPSVPGPPGPPPGPGVYPPFPAPPVEGKGKRVGWGVGIAAGVVVLICGGGLAALIGIGVSATGAMQERAEAAVSDYLDAVQAKRYDDAYDLLCDSTREDESSAEFRARITGQEAITEYTFGDFNIVNMSLPVDVTYLNGASAEVSAALEQDTDTGDFEVCSLGE
ncbi:hypothetical protein BJ973_005725 [Actinoplanes tereljensis]|uniref:DUF4878 domain-containing protein n=1 Tax=Paractinoplanes tereljensis TaxID=571912 RepID=A0A919NW86_9ACTN|nr:hypothetical protein [Actinoplanes tereljensis]GIF26365.1 hypothetical protein Ate02nite_90950 [Actinoplanes tereljensis]